ncbi:Crp/Fnr family transcriptional regulator [Rhizobium sp. NFR12]|uniref:Crp/Fnr family transcriptional regulator n=1 Tax=Rhizobium sp. NFR12 TaxID=1566261 RepID=UPI0008A7F801|nr:Crp/Fnr family transcriptional regulator [Rhizobium sp. NFR12]SEH30958.1 cAMP-binding domain of CRP or a regulatory subunit of cAMP-dependent protein kinases [Rhizobium sp. NFR12]
MNAFVRKLECFRPLNQSDKALIEVLTEQKKRIRRRTDLVKEGTSTDVVHVILEGYAIRHKVVGNGTRQIFSYLVPGDICDLHVALLAEMDHTVSTLSDCMVAQIRRPSILDIVAERPALTRALWWTMLVDEAVLREWVTNLGARRAELRIAHLFCEIHARLQAVGLVDDDVFTLPITQQELGDTVGLSLVHVSRSLKLLRDRGLASFQNHRIEIPDIRRMREFADFNANYLHLQPTRSLIVNG